MRSPRHGAQAFFRDRPARDLAKAVAAVLDPAERGLDLGQDFRFAFQQRGRDVALGLIFRPAVPVGLEPYLPIAVVAALDAVFGALRAFLDGIFDDKVFVVSFLSNVVIAAGIVWMGDKLGVGGQLSTGVIVVLGIRIFSNVAAIRRHLFHA